MSGRRAWGAPAPGAARLAGAGLAVVALVGAASACATPVPAERTTPAAPPGVPQPASYIVVLDDGVASPAVVAGQHAGLGFATPADEVYSHALKGYAAELTAVEAAMLRADERVVHVEPDRTIEIAQLAQQVPTGVRRIFADRNPVVGINGVDDARIDVDVAVIDSGISDHADLHVVARTDCTQGTCVDTAGGDDTGHGTHVAGTIAALDDGAGVVGVAPGARLHSVKVCGAGGQCPLSSVIAGVDYVTARAGVIEVANLSLAGRGSSFALDTALTAAIDAGIVPVVAAGNSREDAAGWFPGSHPDVITVSAVADADGLAGGLAAVPTCQPQSVDEVLADFSNFGAPIDIAAPGVCILSTWNDGGLAMMSGTSMATPHVAGAAAVLARGPGDPTSREGVLAIRQRLVDSGNLDWVDDSGDGMQEPLLDMTELT